MKILVVVDMQNDFIDGALGTKEAEGIVDNVVAEISSWRGPVICTRDTHTNDYLDTQEGKKLPVVHCVKESDGWKLNEKVQAAADAKGAMFIDKPSFGSTELPKFIDEIVSMAEDGGDVLEGIELIGLCTDICVISNTLILKAAFPEIPVSVKASCCAGVTPEQHDNALAAMGPCQVDVI